MGPMMSDPFSSSRELASGGVLIVEDEPLIAADLAQAFEEAGARVAGVAPNVGTALALIARAGRLEGAVLDINLRGAMAYPVADELVRRSVPFLFATGYGVATIPARFAHVTRCEKPMKATRIVRMLLLQRGQRNWSQAPRLSKHRGSAAS